MEYLKAIPSNRKFSELHVAKSKHLNAKLEVDKLNTRPFHIWDNWGLYLSIEYHVILYTSIKVIDTNTKLMTKHQICRYFIICFLASYTFINTLFNVPYNFKLN